MSSSQCSFFSSCLPTLTLTKVSCIEPAVYLWPSGLSSLSPQSLPEHFDRVPIRHLPRCQAYRWRPTISACPRGHGVMQRYKPLTGVLLRRWIHEDSLQAHWRSGPLVKTQVKGTSEPSESYNPNLAARSLTNTKKHTTTNSLTRMNTGWSNTHIHAWQPLRPYLCHSDKTPTRTELKGEGQTEERTLMKRWQCDDGGDEARRQTEIDSCWSLMKDPRQIIWQKVSTVGKETFSIERSGMNVTLWDLILFLCNIMAKSADWLELHIICCLASSAYLTLSISGSMEHHPKVDGPLRTANST